MKRCPLLIAFVVGISTIGFCQDSLGDAARQVRAEKAAQPHAKIVVDDEIAPLKTRSPFPEISLKGLDNSSEICRAMEEYRKNHTKDEFENAVHEWFDDYDQMVRLYLKQQVLAQERRNDQYASGPVYRGGDYQNYWEDYQRRQRADEIDRRQMYMDQVTITRVQQGLGKVQTYLVNRSYTFRWFKIRHSATDDDI